jgi:pilus assembly protein CpaE
MFERSLVRHASGVHLLAAPRAFADVRHVTPDGVRQAVNVARTLFPYVVADLDHSFREEQLQVVRQADLILLVLRLDFNALRHGQRCVDYLRDLGISQERLRLVVNRYGQPKEVPHTTAEGALGMKIAHYVPDDPRTVNRANNSGVPAVLEYPRARVSRSIARLAASVNGKPDRRR